jgi:hypothetical protein
MHNRSLKVAVKGPDFGPPLKHTYIHTFVPYVRPAHKRDIFCLLSKLRASCEVKTQETSSVYEDVPLINIDGAPTSQSVGVQ